MLRVGRIKEISIHEPCIYRHWEKSLVIKFAARLTAWIAFAGLFSLLSAAQQTTPPSPDSTAQPQTQAPAQSQTSPAAQQAPADKDKPTGTDKKGQDASTTQGKVPGTSSDRLGYILPNFLTLENGGTPPPLTWKQKYEAVARGTFDPVQYPWWAFLASLDQAANSDAQLGQGWKGYAERYGLVAGDGIIENFMTQAVFPSILRQDPRFFQTSQGSFVHRSGYSITRIVITRGDSGHRQFNYSEIFGSGFAAAISTYSYHPRSAFISTPSNPHEFVDSDRTFRNFASTWGTQVSLDTMTIVIKEFWPDIRRKIPHKKKVEPGSTTPASSNP
jgi:hypothetical protein